MLEFLSVLVGFFIGYGLVFLIENHGDAALDALARRVRGSGTLRGGRRFDVEDMLAGIEGRDQLRVFDAKDRARLNYSQRTVPDAARPFALA